MTKVQTVKTQTRLSERELDQISFIMQHQGVDSADEAWATFASFDQRKPDEVRDVYGLPVPD